MTLDELVTMRRIPTAPEFLEFIGGQGWSVRVNPDGTAALGVKDARDELALAFARMLSREPYRTNVLKLVAGPPAEGKPAEPQAPLPPTPEGTPEFPYPPPEPAAAPVATEPGVDPWGNLVHRSGVDRPTRAVELVGSERRTCAYIRVRLVPEEAYPWEEWQPAERQKYPATHFRVQHPAAVVPLTRAAFADLFPAAG